MAGLSDTWEAMVLDCIFNATNITAPTEVWVKHHVADPGEAGTANAATETTRKQLSCSAAVAGDITSDATLGPWVSVAGSEDYTHFSLWTASSGGTCIGTGTTTANAVTAGDTFSVAAGDFDWSQT